MPMRIDVRVFPFEQAGDCIGHVTQLIVDRAQFAVAEHPQDRNATSTGWIVSHHTPPPEPAKAVPATA